MSRQNAELAVTGVPFEGTYRGVGDRVVACHRMRGRGKESGVEVDLALTDVVPVRGGRRLNITDHWTREEALEAVGLRE